MGSVISAKNLAGSIEKARGLGIVEERVPLGPECEIVVRNLRPDQYEQALAECSGLEGMDYLNMYQKAHVSRAICELNGQSVRDTKFVETEEPDPKNPTQIKLVKLELHDFIRKYVVDTWGKEVLFVVYRKFGDAVAEAEKRSKEGIEFSQEEETSEEKLRRLLGEVREAQSELPQELVIRTLADFGLMERTTAEQAKSVDEALSNAPQMPTTGAPVAPETAAQEVVSPATIDPAKLMRKRVPLNREPDEQQPPPRWAPNQTPAAAPAGPPAPIDVPATRPRISQQPPQALANNPQFIYAQPPVQPVVPVPPVLNTPQPGAPAMSRAERIAALEAEADPTLGASLAGSPQTPRFMPGQAPEDAPTLSGTAGATGTDPSVLFSGIDPAPPAGINPLYRAPR